MSYGALFGLFFVLALGIASTLAPEEHRAVLLIVAGAAAIANVAAALVNVAGNRARARILDTPPHRP